MSSNKPCSHRFQPRYTSALTLSESLRALSDKLLTQNCPEAIWVQFNRVINQYRKTKIYVYDICIKCGETRKEQGT